MHNFCTARPIKVEKLKKTKNNSCIFPRKLLKYESARVYCVIIVSEEVFGLPNIKSAKKRVLVNKTKAMQNKAAKSALKTDIKKFEAAVAEGNRSEADIAYKVAVKAVDKAVGHGLLHRNNAARKKSALTLKLNKLA